MRDKLEGKIIEEFNVLRAKKYSYLTKKDNRRKKTKIRNEKIQKVCYEKNLNLTIINIV